MLLSLFVITNFTGTCSSVEMLKGYMFREGLGTLVLEQYTWSAAFCKVISIADAGLHDANSTSVVFFRELPCFLFPEMRGVGMNLKYCILNYNQSLRTALCLKCHLHVVGTTKVCDLVHVI